MGRDRAGDDHRLSIAAHRAHDSRHVLDPLVERMGRRRSDSALLSLDPLLEGAIKGIVDAWIVPAVVDSLVEQLFRKR